MSSQSVGVDRPIFVIGTGRSGTTLFHNLIAYRPQLAWFSTWSSRYPQWPQLAAAASVLDIPVIGPLLHRWDPGPTEVYRTLTARSPLRC